MLKVLAGMNNLHHQEQWPDASDLRCKPHTYLYLPCSCLALNRDDRRAGALVKRRWRGSPKLWITRTQKNNAYSGDPVLDVVICCLMSLQGVRCPRRWIQSSAVVY